MFRNFSIRQNFPTMPSKAFYFFATKYPSPVTMESILLFPSPNFPLLLDTKFITVSGIDRLSPKSLSLSLSSEYLLCQNIRNSNLLLCFQYLLLPFSLSFYSIHYRLVVFAERSFVRGWSSLLCSRSCRWTWIHT